MEKKRKKDAEKEAGKAGFKLQSKQPQIAVRPKPAPKASQPALTEKDKVILQDVEHIIWNPDLLKKLPNNGKARRGKSK